MMSVPPIRKLTKLPSKKPPVSDASEPSTTVLKANAKVGPGEPRTSRAMAPSTWMESEFDAYVTTTKCQSPSLYDELVVADATPEPTLKEASSLPLASATWIKSTPPWTPTTASTPDGATELK